MAGFSSKGGGLGEAQTLHEGCADNDDAHAQVVLRGHRGSHPVRAAAGRRGVAVSAGLLEVQLATGANSALPDAPTAAPQRRAQIAHCVLNKAGDARSVGRINGGPMSGDLVLREDVALKNPVALVPQEVVATTSRTRPTPWGNHQGL